MAMIDKDPLRRPGLEEIETALRSLSKKFGPAS
jgi:hypothetical protein